MLYALCEGEGRNAILHCASFPFCSLFPDLLFAIDMLRFDGLGTLKRLEERMNHVTTSFQHALSLSHPLPERPIFALVDCIFDSGVFNIVN